jgi:hypothetical protein
MTAAAMTASSIDVAGTLFYALLIVLLTGAVHVRGRS